MRAPDINDLKENFEHKYVASPTLSKFHASNGFVRGIRGPIGSGKSVGCVNEILRRSIEQAPFKGRRCSRWIVVRNTSLELRNTSLKTFKDWVPETICKYVMHPQIEAHLVMPLEDGTELDLEVIFLAMDSPDDVKKLLSFEATGIWINEAKEIEYAILDGATGRVGRYPAKKDGGCTWSGIIMDTNPPDDDHWWYTAAEVETPDGWAFFSQPPALLEDPMRPGRYVPNPAAENIENHSLGFTYYLRQVPGKTKQWVQVYLMGLYGTDVSGLPVYRDHWNDGVHISSVELQPVKGRTVYVGWDFGLTPCAIIGQLDPAGGLNIIDELTTDRMGLKFFAEGAVIPLLASKYAGCPVVSVADPAGKSGTSNDELTNLQQLAKLGLVTEEARTNDPVQRHEAVRWFLSRMAGGRPGFQMNKNCSVLRKGFNGGYRYKRVRHNGGVRYLDQVEDNQYTHPHDGLQYLCLKAMPVITLPKRPKAVQMQQAADSTTGY